MTEKNPPPIPRPINIPFDAHPIVVQSAPDPFGPLLIPQWPVTPGFESLWTENGVFWEDGHKILSTIVEDLKERHISLLPEPDLPKMRAGIPIPPAIIFPGNDTPKLPKEYIPEQYMHIFLDVRTKVVEIYSEEIDVVLAHYQHRYRDYNFSSQMINSNVWKHVVYEINNTFRCKENERRYERHPDLWMIFSECCGIPVVGQVRPYKIISKKIVPIFYRRGGVP